MVKRNRIVAILLALWVLLSGILSLTGYGFALFGYGEVNRHRIINNQPKIVDSIQISPVVEENIFQLAAIPFFTYFKIGPPYSIGIRVVDYWNKNKLKKLELIKLEITNENFTKTIISGSELLSTNFQTYVQGVEHVIAECIVSYDKLDFINYQKPIMIKATFRIYKKGEIIKETLEEEILPSRSTWKGFYRFWDILFA